MRIQQRKQQQQFIQVFACFHMNVVTHGRKKKFLTWQKWNFQCYILGKFYKNTFFSSKAYRLQLRIFINILGPAWLCNLGTDGTGICTVLSLLLLLFFFSHPEMNFSSRTGHGNHNKTNTNVTGIFKIILI